MSNDTFQSAANHLSSTSDLDASEEINVIPVEQKKQRVNDDYIDLDSGQLRQIVDDDSGEDDDDDYYDSDDGEIQHFLPLLLEANNNISLEQLEHLPPDIVDDLALVALKNHCIRVLRAEIDSWPDVLIIPERMREALLDLTRGRLSRLSNVCKTLIIKKCLNYLDTYNLTFPFISDEDLDPTSD